MIQIFVTNQKDLKKLEQVLSNSQTKDIWKILLLPILSCPKCGQKFFEDD